MNFNMSKFDKRYYTGDLPWDSGTPCIHLTEYVENSSHSFESALELGCGTGTNANFLADKDKNVYACDFSPKAIEIAKEKYSNPRVDFQVMDILTYNSTLEGKFDFVFDRGCFHSVSKFKRKKFVKHIRRYMKGDGTWLLLCGSKEETKNLHMGPPRLSVQEIAKAVEPYFKIKEIQATIFSTNGERHAWRCTLTPR